MQGKYLKEKSRQYFDDTARNGDIIPEPLLCYPEVLTALQKYEIRTLADIGCGTGGMLKVLRESYGNSLQLFGLDLSPVSVEKAMENIPEAVIKTGDAEDVPFEDGMFDTVLCMHSFHHYPEPMKALSEIRRILDKTQGKFILVENNWSEIKRLRINVRYVLKAHEDGDVKCYSEKQLAEMLTAAGFTITESRKIGEHSILFECRA